MSSFSRCWLPVRLGVKRRASYIPSEGCDSGTERDIDRVGALESGKIDGRQGGAVYRRPARSMTSSAGMWRRLKV